MAAPAPFDVRTRWIAPSDLPPAACRLPLLSRITLDVYSVRALAVTPRLRLAAMTRYTPPRS
jgi:hypothetical protein